MPDPSCPAGSEQKDASQKLVWVDNDTIAAALGDWWTVLSYLRYIPPFLPVWLPTFCATVPTGPFEISDEDWASLASGDGFTVVDVLNVVRNRVNWYVWNEYCQCVGTDEGTPVACYSDAVLEDSPYLYWPLAETSGAFVDASGNGRDGTLTGAATRGGVGPFTGSSAVHFVSGGSTYVRAPAGVSVPGSSWTIELWARADPTAPADGNIAGVYGTGAGQRRLGYGGLGGGHNEFLGAAADASGTATISRDGMESSLRKGGWNYWVVRYDATANLLSLWADGAQRDSDAVSGGSATSSVDFMIGTILISGAPATNSFSGSISNVALYDYALSDSRIAAHYAARLGGCPTNPTPIDPPDTPALPTGFDAPPPLECDEAQLCVDINRIRIDLANAATMVNTIQRQSAPFAYQLVDTFTISGSGTLSVRGILALSVDFTAIPTYKSHKGSAVVDYLDLGYLNLGTTDGWTTREILRHDGHLVADIPGYVDRVGYDLAPGVAATLRTYRRLA